MKLLFLILSVMFFASCGSQEKEPAPSPVQPVPSPAPNPNPNPTPDPTQEFNATIKPILQKNCGGASCHTSGGARDAATASLANFTKGTSGSRIQSGNMPPSGSSQAGSFSAADKSTLLGFIAKYK